ncbi:hypothetical protein H2LOC_012295 [Methylocystis heyeri]|uniref:Uncharacterized protein n=1 Tax=Methylocystis heyeri TaxID=391905 RepID=A0A6B8KFN8_9HYPH|nr:hypothetical protein H2LOC_012295 [Methylocystis heyeri]
MFLFLGPAAQTISTACFPIDILPTITAVLYGVSGEQPDMSRAIYPVSSAAR